MFCLSLFDFNSLKYMIIVLLSLDFVMSSMTLIHLFCKKHVVMVLSFQIAVSCVTREILMQL